MTITADLSKLLIKGINDSDSEARGDWDLEYKDKIYSVKVKKFANRTEYQIKDGRKIIARYQLVAVEV